MAKLHTPTPHSPAQSSRCGRFQPQPRPGHRPLPRPPREGARDTHGPLLPPAHAHTTGNTAGLQEARVSPKTAGPPWRTIFRFNGDYSGLLPRTAFRKAAGQAGRASSGDPRPPSSQAVQTSRAHCFWNNGPHSFQDQGEPSGCRSQQGPGPWQTPWQLGGSLGEHPDDHGLQWLCPRMRPSRDSRPRGRKGAAWGPLSGGPTPGRPSPPAPGVQFPDTWPGAQVPQGHNAPGDLFCRQGRSRPAQGGGPATSLSPLPLPHTDWVPAAAPPRPPLIRPCHPLRMKPPGELQTETQEVGDWPKIHGGALHLPPAP